jgi:molybdopterin-guanine dinucleotide biosynthesis protein B
MKVFGLAGFSGSGKTALLVRLLPVLSNLGLRVSTIKHAHHNFDVDIPGKDSFEHRSAGAYEVMISSQRRWALMHEHRNEDEANLDELIAQMADVDLVLVEGFKREGHDKIEVVREENSVPSLYQSDSRIVAFASDCRLPDLPLPVLDLNDTKLIADFIVDHCGLDVPQIRKANMGLKN